MWKQFFSKVIFAKEGFLSVYKATGHFLQRDNKSHWTLLGRKHCRNSLVGILPSNFLLDTMKWKDKFWDFPCCGKWPQE